MVLPPFTDFLKSFDPDKVDYDITHMSTESMKRPYNPFSKEEYSLLVETAVLMAKVYLCQYHNWLNGILSEREKK